MRIQPKPVPMDLPAYYTWQYSEIQRLGRFADKQPYAPVIGNVESDSEDIPPVVIEQLFSRPNQPQIPQVNVQGWSTDWIKFEFLEQWVVPTLRWGYRDYLYENSGVLHARRSTPFLVWIKS